jgi:hypothetical protein
MFGVGLHFSLAHLMSVRAIAIPGANARTNQGGNARNSRDTGFALQVFGRSIRESNCDCDRSMDASLLQTVYLQNDSSVLAAIEGARDSWIEQLTKRGPGQLADGSNAERMDVPREIERMKVRLKRAREKKDADQVQRIQARLRELEKAADAKEAAEKDPEGISLDGPELVRQAYLRTLSRLPTPVETARCMEFLAAADSPAAGAKGLLWTLINTKEFIVNH